MQVPIVPFGGRHWWRIGAPLACELSCSLNPGSGVANAANRIRLPGFRAIAEV